MNIVYILSIVLVTLVSTPTAFSDENTNNSNFVIGNIQWEKAGYRLSEQPTVEVRDPDMNLNPNEKDSFEIDVWGDSDRGGLNLIVVETEINSAIFKGTLSFSTTEQSEDIPPRLRVAEGDEITASYEDQTLPPPWYSPDSELDVNSIAIVGESIPQVQDWIIADDLKIKSRDNPVNTHIIRVGEESIFAANLDNLAGRYVTVLHIVTILDEIGNELTTLELNQRIDESTQLRLLWTPIQSGNFTAEYSIIENHFFPKPLSNSLMIEFEVIEMPESILPQWIRNIFIWYAEERISEDELLGAIQFLIDQGILKS